MFKPFHLPRLSGYKTFDTITVTNNIVSITKNNKTSWAAVEVTDKHR